ncbi:MAG: polyprenol monophosphomannose synthase [Nitrososphaerota archaeon]
MGRVVVITPTYNEAETIDEHIRNVLSVLSSAGIDGHILIIDDNSPDGTAEIVSKIANSSDRVMLIVRPGRMGLGSAYINGFRHVLEKMEDVEAVVEMDADGSHDSHALPQLVAPILRGEFDVVVGSRYVGWGRWSGETRGRELISRGANFLARICTGVKVKDLTSGYRAISARILRLVIDDLKAASRGYTFQVESLVEYANRGARIKEVPIIFLPRRKGKSKLGISEIIYFFLWNVKYFFSRRVPRIFLG